MREQPTNRPHDRGDTPFVLRHLPPMRMILELFFEQDSRQESSPSLHFIAPTEAVIDASLAPPEVPFNEFYNALFNSLGSYRDTRGIKWDVENLDQLDRFVVGIQQAQVPVDLLQPRRVVNDIIAKKITVFYGLERDTNEIELRLSRSTLGGALCQQRIEADRILRAQQDRKRLVEQRPAETGQPSKHQKRLREMVSDETVEEKEARRERAAIAQARAIKAAEERARKFYESKKKMKIKIKS
jgi:hypothetical protein